MFAINHLETISPSSYRGVFGECTLPRLTSAAENNGRGPYVAFIGASACGKTWIVKQLMNAGLVHNTPTWTTRPMRATEADSQSDHIFVSQSQFASARQAGRFALQGKLYGYEYGMPDLRPVYGDGPVMASSVILKDHVVEDFRSLYPDSAVYQLESEDGLDVMQRAMTERGQANADIAVRLDAYKGELERGRDLADRVFSTPGHPQHMLDGVRRALHVDSQFDATQS